MIHTSKEAHSRTFVTGGSFFARQKVAKTSFSCWQGELVIVYHLSYLMGALGWLYPEGYPRIGVLGWLYPSGCPRILMAVGLTWLIDPFFCADCCPATLIVGAVVNTVHLTCSIYACAGCS